MLITFFNGSPRRENGVTHLMAMNFLKGAQKAGAETDYIFLERKKIQHCMGCFACWFKTPGKCAIIDDMQDLLDRYLRSDVVVFASPIYVGSVTGIMKDFIDRLLPLFDPRLQIDDKGRNYHLSRYEHSPDVVILSNCGNPNQAHFEFFRSTFDCMKTVYRMNIIGEIFIGAGVLLKGFVPGLEDTVEQYLQLLQNSGEEIVQNRMLSKELQQKLQKPIVPFHQAVEQANQVIEALLDGLPEDLGSPSKKI